ncbi:MAG: class I SAM-dependent methyltransferase [Myxococcota bacterium]
MCVALRNPDPDGPIRARYVEHGADGYYAAHGGSYRNPHEDGVRRVVAAHAPHLGPGRILDLACGSGEVTLALRELGVAPDAIDGADPYTGAAYRARTGRDALPWTFADLPDQLGDRVYAACVCSMALHLCPTSRLPSVLFAVARAARVLVVISPHKRPEIRPSWGWTLVRTDYDREWRLRSWRFSSTVAAHDPVEGSVPPGGAGDRTRDGVDPRSCPPWS